MLQIVQRSQNNEPAHWLELALTDGALGLRNRIRELRRERKMSQERLAELRGVTHGTISRLEKGGIKVTDHYLRLLSAAFGVPPVQVLSDDPLPKTDRQRELARLVQDLPDSATDALIATARAMGRKDEDAA